MKLVRKEQKSYAINISVDFDRTKHLSDASVKRRKVVRDRCITKEQARDEEERKKKAAELDKKEQEKFVYIFPSVVKIVPRTDELVFAPGNKRRPNGSCCNNNSWSARTSARKSSCRSCAPRSKSKFRPRFGPRRRSCSWRKRNWRVSACSKLCLNASK